MSMIDVPDNLITLPVQPPKQSSANATPQLVARLAEQFGAQWVDEASVAAWSAEGGDRVVLLAGDPVQFPEGLDVAVVLREDEAAVARRYGSQRWPTLLFLRDGQYVATVSGMHDWEVFIERVTQALAMPTSRAPTIGIPVVGSNTGSGTSCA